MPVRRQIGSDRILGVQAAMDVQASQSFGLLPLVFLEMTTAGRAVRNVESQNALIAVRI
jgi:hypothetical protein